MHILIKQYAKLSKPNENLIWNSVFLNVHIKPNHIIFMFDSNVFNKNLHQ